MADSPWRAPHEVASTDADSGIPTTGRPLAGPYSDICDVAAACVKDFKKILDNSFTQ